MLRELTVREILMHSAQMRLPRSWSARQISRKVDETIELLGLKSVENEIIGDEERRGISGGQRRRVNIGMELVAEPSILFLDEPISGIYNYKW
jgi:ABC-type multidrug transport system ATPase subunit